MSIRGDGFRTQWRRSWLTRLLLVSFVLRALIPAGFMPDFNAASKGIFKVTICTAAGESTLLLDEDGKPVPAHSGKGHDQPCAFTGLAAIALPSFDAVQIVAPAYTTITTVLSTEVRLPPARAGPPLGSRGPPQLS